MKYEDLNLNQRIMIKGAIETNGKSFDYKVDLSPFRAVWLLWDFRKAVDMLLDKLVNNQ